MINDNVLQSGRKIFFIIFCFIIAIAANNSIPYISLPTMGQALWTLGYAKSLSHSGFFSIYAHDIGIPKPAAIAFGLSAVLPISWFIKFGMLPEAAYSLVFSIWLGVSFWACYKFSRLFNADQYNAALFSMLWLITPMVTKHSGYSMLMLGIALLPFYCWCAYCFITSKNTFSVRNFLYKVLFFASTIVSIFMDGYTFIMYAVAAAGMMFFLFINYKNKVSFIYNKFPLFAFSFIASYFLYSNFIGKTSYQPESLDFFRGWGVDLSFLFLPTKGIFWLFDRFGLSKTRLDSEYFGDASVWETSFIFPFLIIGSIGWYFNRGKNSFVNFFLLLGLFSIYMALGPSFKINSTKPDGYELINSLHNTMLMPKEYAVFSTGSSYISECLPGFNVMRASYRWLALGLFCFWCLTIFAIRNKNGWVKHTIVIVLIILYSPHVRYNFEYGRANFYAIGNINDRFVSNLKKDIPATSKVAFIPWNNDFFANYLAPFANFKTFNIGGDKNLDIARAYWPPIMNNLQGSISEEKVPYMVQLLMDKNVDYIIVPYVNMLWSAHYWLCPSQTLLPLNDQTRALLVNEYHLDCPDVIKNNLKNVINVLRNVPFIDVIDRDLYAVVTIDQQKYHDYEQSHQSSYPLQIQQDNYSLSKVLKNGWYYPENGHVWSKSEATLELTLNEKKTGSFNLKYNVFITEKNNPVKVIFKTMVKGRVFEIEKVITNSDNIIATIPIDAGSSAQIVNITIFNAKSPAEVGLSPDKRVLGISLQTISFDE